MAAIETIRRVHAEGAVAVTFDDGPDPVMTPRILEILTRFDATGTFFVLGKQVQPELVQAIVSQGSEIGNHSFNHPSLTGLGEKAIYGELESTRRAVEEAGATMSGFFRPPYGNYDQRVLEVAGRAGYRYNVLWNVDPRDWKRPGAQTIVSRALSSVEAGNIYLFHDWVDQNAEALPQVLAGLQAQGLKVVFLSRLLENAVQEAAQEYRELRLTTPYLRGDDVAQVQRRLMERGFDPGAVDGIYGRMTESAVRSFQEAAGLPVDGVVSRAVYESLGIYY